MLHCFCAKAGCLALQLFETRDNFPGFNFPVSLFCLVSSCTIEEKAVKNFGFFCSMRLKQFWQSYTVQAAKFQNEFFLLRG